MLDHDVLTCDKCGGRREVRAFASSPALARKALEDLGVAFEPLKIAKGHDRIVARQSMSGASTSCLSSHGGGGSTGRRDGSRA